MSRYVAIAVLTALLLTLAVSDTVTAQPAKEFKPFQYAVFAWKELKATGNVRTDSYGSPYTRKTAKQGGHIRSNKLVRLKGSARVCGDAYCAAEIEVEGKAQITGKQYPDSLLYEIPRLRPFFKKFAQAENNLNSEIRNSELGNEPLDKDGDFTLTGKDCYTLAPGNYCFRNLKLAGGATLDVRQRANIYVTGSIKITGASRVNYWLKDASKCMIMSESGDIVISGNSQVYAMIYAPESPVVIEGTADVFGSVIGGEVTLKGDAEIHLPEAVKSFTIDVNVETLEPTKIWPPPVPPKPLVKGLLVCPDPAKPMLVNTKRWYNVHLLDQCGNVIPLSAFPTSSNPRLTQVSVEDKSLVAVETIEAKRLKYRLRCKGSGSTTYGIVLQVPTNPPGETMLQQDEPSNQEKKVKVDLDIIKPGTKPPKEKVWDEKTEDEEGEVVPVNIDDDDKDTKAGHGKFPTPDKDDTDGVKNEDDMIKLKIRKLEGAKGKFVLKYDKSYIVLWKKPTKEKKHRITSEVTEFPTDQETPIYVEGIKEHKDQKVTLQLKEGDKVVGKDLVKIVVAKTIIALFGDKYKGSWTDGKQLLETYLEKDNNRKKVKGFLDPRKGPYIFKGKDGTYYAVWSTVMKGGTELNPIWNSEKGFKMALTIENALVVLLAHSNFGIGPAFQKKPKKISDFVNIAGANWGAGSGYTSIPLSMYDKYKSSITKKMIPKEPKNYIIKGLDTVDRFPNDDGVDAQDPEKNTFTLKEDAKKRPYHYTWGNTKYLILRSGDQDKPKPSKLKYNVFYYAGCTTIGYFYEVFKHGTVFLTQFTLYNADSGPRTFVETIIENGEDANNILKKLNKAHRHPKPKFNPQVYKFGK